MIHKQKLIQKYPKTPNNPYKLALEFCLERLQYHLNDVRAGGGKVHVVMESRDNADDKRLKTQFNAVCVPNLAGRQFPFEPVFVDKKANSAGLQIADLIAGPIGRHVLSPDAPNPVYSLIEPKLRRGPDGHPTLTV